MKPEDKTIRIGAAVILAAVLLRLFTGNLPGKLVAFFSQQEVAAALVFAQTGRVIRFPEVTSPAPTQQTEPTVMQQAPAVFSAEDAQLISINNASGYTVDTETFLSAPLTWELIGQAPTVLILHTHGSESYTGSCDNETTYRTLDEAKNMLAVGDLVASLLEGAGIGVIHDRTIHDYPSYNGAYNHARTQTDAYLKEYPSIRLILDLHRDAMEDGTGKQLCTTVDVKGQKSSQLMMVVGSSAGGLHHPAWQENMALALKLHVQLEKLYPGICRPVSFRYQRFNQDLSPGAMLIEVGTAGNTLPQALVAAQCLANAIIALSMGANC